MIGARRVAGWRRWTSRRVLGLGIVTLLCACEEGRAPYPVIDPDGTPSDFLPEDGVTPSTIRTDGLIYRFDRTRFRVFAPLPGTDPRFVRRDSVLALNAAGVPGAPQSLLLRPDLSDPTLAAVYADPRLFGFEAAPPASVGFVAGRRTSSAADFYPIQPGNRWDMNHNGREWTAVDSVLGPTPPPPTAAGMPVTRVVLTSRARPDLRNAFQPAVFDQFADFTVAPGVGIYYHAWQLTAERVVPRDRRPPGTLIDRQRNPRFLWLPVGQSNDPTGLNQVSLDHCVDELPAYLELVPLKITDDEIQEGATYTTWTYLTIDTNVLRQRLNTERELPGGGRCGFEFVTGMDTLRLFPTRSFRMLVRFDCSVQRIVDQVTLIQGESVLGRYPKTATANSMVKFRIVMTASSGFGEVPAQLVDLWLQRGIGPVIRDNGVFELRRSRARLRSAVVNGVVYPPDASNPAFEYFDE